MSGMGLFQRPVNMKEFYTSLILALFAQDEEDTDSEEDPLYLKEGKSQESTRIDGVEEGERGEDGIRREENTPIQEEITYLPWSTEVQASLGLFSEILSLETQVEGWTTKVTSATATISVKFVTFTQAPSPRGELPIVRAFFDFDLDVTPDDLYAVLYHVDLRKKWDTVSVLEYEEFDKPFPDAIKYYMVNKVPWPFANRDFVERRLIRKTTTGDIEINFHHIEHPVRPM